MPNDQVRHLRIHIFITTRSADKAFRLSDPSISSNDRIYPCIATKFLHLTFSLQSQESSNKKAAIDYYRKTKEIQRRDLMTLSLIGHCLHADAKANKRHVHLLLQCKGERCHKQATHLHDRRTQQRQQAF